MTYDPKKPFSLVKYGGCSIDSFNLRELDGQESIDALARAAPPGASVNQAALQPLHTAQLVASSITHVNGEAVPPGPYQGWQSWNLRTQDFVLLAYTRVNGVTKKEMDDFLGENFGSLPAGSSTSSSANGAGSPGT